MCSFCYGEIYLDGPAHVCNSNWSSIEQQQVAPDSGKKTVSRISLKANAVAQDK